MDTTRKYPRTLSEAFPVSEGYHDAFEGPERQYQYRVPWGAALAAALVVAALMMLSGCGGGGGDPAPTEKKATLCQTLDCKSTSEDRP